MFLAILLFASIGYLLFAANAVLHRISTKQIEDEVNEFPITAYVLAGAVPLGVAFVMMYLFLIVGTSTVVQGNVGSSPHISAWLRWNRLFEPLLVLSALNGLGCLVWVLACLAYKIRGEPVVVSVFTFLLSVLALMAVGAFMPTA